MIMFPIVFTVLLVLAVLVALALRSWGREEARMEALIESPETHTVSYVVPDGQDPAIVAAALHEAGFPARAHLEGGFEVLRIACAEQERDTVRSVIEHVDRTGFDGAPMHIAHARFVDET
jgi:hypothetical protein